MKVLTNEEMCHISGGCYIMVKTMYAIVNTILRSLKFHY